MLLLLATCFEISGGGGFANSSEDLGFITPIGEVEVSYHIQEDARIALSGSLSELSPGGTGYHFRGMFYKTLHEWCYAAPYVGLGMGAAVDAEEFNKDVELIGGTVDAELGVDFLKDYCFHPRIKTSVSHAVIGHKVDRKHPQFSFSFALVFRL